MNKLLKLTGVLALALVLSPVAKLFAYDIPRQDAKARYFYVFGPEGNVLDGKEASNEVKFYFDVPETETASISIKVFDPEVGGTLDQAIQPWNTETEFTVQGASELDKKVFGVDPQWDGKFYRFGPYEKNQGEKVGDKYRFTLTAKGISGDDLNIFYVRVSPDSLDAFSDKFTFVLLPNQGDKMSFYPEVPAGVQKITVRNFDLDKDGGVSTLKDRATGQVFPVNDSESGEWKDTQIDLSGTETRRLEYQVTTTNQTNGHAGLQVLDDKGNALPIYFKHGKAPKPQAAPAPVREEVKAPALSCNQFTFDARKSYDANNKNLTYLWDFGDGVTSTDAVVSHVYEKGGAYNVSLTVSDNSGLHCEKNTTTSKVDVNTPPVASLKGPELVCVGSEVELDASATQDDDASKMSYAWDFGDGTHGEGAQVKKTYAKGGTYKVKLNVNDGSGSSCSADAAAHTVRVNTPPQANAGKDVSMCLRGSEGKFDVSLNGSGSSDADGDSLKYSWDFGDGTSGEGEKASHTYEKPGQYTAKLLVSDGSGASCDSASSTVNIDLNQSPVAVAGKDQSVCTGESVSLDAGESTAAGEKVKYSWDFGDGETAEGKAVQHTYAKGGSYSVRLAVDDGLETKCSSATDGLKVHVNSAPTVQLSQVEAICSGDKVHLKASASDADGDKLSYSWDFGDGTTEEGGSSVSHVYEKGGSYTVRVSVSDGSQQSCSNASDTTTVKVNSKPVANAGKNLVCCQDETSPFDASGSTDADGDNLTYRWDFGDGASSTDAKAEHAYTKDGSYAVKLTVDDGSGTRCATDSTSFEANVNAQPVAVIQIKQK